MPKDQTLEPPSTITAAEWNKFLRNNLTQPGLGQLLTDALMALKAIIECDRRTDCLAGNAHIKESVRACIENIERAKSL